MNAISNAEKERQDLAVLTSSRVANMLRVAFRGQGTLRSWALHKVHHRPGAGVSVGYTVIIDNADTGVRKNLYVVASTAKIPACSIPNLRHLSAGETKVALWEYPYDPLLPALPTACNPEKMRELVGEPVELELLGYRPTRRAVVRVNRENKFPLYAKVVPLSEQDDLVRRVALMAETSIPTPTLVAQHDGLVLLTQVSGVPLVQLFANVKRSDPNLPKLLNHCFFSLSKTLSALPRTALQLPARPAWVDRCEQYAQAAAAVLPEVAERCYALARDIRAVLKTADMGALVPTHGDFYEANIYVDPTTGTVSGLLDLDSLGAGYRVNDWACLLAHLSVLSSLAPHKYKIVDEVVNSWFNRLSGSLDSVALAASTAGVVLSLVAGAGQGGMPQNTQARNRLRIAENWLILAQTELLARQNGI